MPFLCSIRKASFVMERSATSSGHAQCDDQLLQNMVFEINPKHPFIEGKMQMLHTHNRF